MHKTEILGLANCDTCRKTRRAFAEAGQEAGFRDLRQDPLSREEIIKLWQSLGPSLLNRASTTWRSLSPDEQADDPVNLLVAHPALIKRPLIISGEQATVGWTHNVQQKWLGGV